MTEKHARDMSAAERAEALAAIKRGPKPEPMPVDKHARDMTPAEQEAFVREVKRRFE
jgi:ribosomal protein L29